MPRCRRDAVDFNAPSSRASNATIDVPLAARERMLAKVAARSGGDGFARRIAATHAAY